MVKLFTRVLAPTLFGLMCTGSWSQPVTTDPGPDHDQPLVINGCPIWPYTRCPGADLRHANLVGKNLAGADFRGADLSRADLRGANLAVADLEGANLTGAKLGKATVSNANLRKVRFFGTDLEGARLLRSDFSGAEFNGASLEIARLDKSWFVGTRFHRQQPSGSQVQHGQPEGRLFRGQCDALRRLSFVQHGGLQGVPERVGLT